MLSLTELFSLQGKVAVVTGASSGIGRMMAQTLAEAGAAVVLVARDPGRLQACADGIRAAGGRAHCLPCDVGDRTRLAAAADAAAAPFGAPDIVISAAGVNPRPLVEAITPEIWDEVMAVNLDAPFFLAQRLAPAMRRKQRVDQFGTMGLQAS